MLNDDETQTVIDRCDVKNSGKRGSDIVKLMNVVSGDEGMLLLVPRSARSHARLLYGFLIF